MPVSTIKILQTLGAALALAVTAQMATAEPRYAIAMYGDPALPPDFVCARVCLCMRVCMCASILVPRSTCAHSPA